MADFKVQSMTTAKPYGRDGSRGAINPRKLGAHNHDVANDEPPNLQQTA